MEKQRKNDEQHAVNLAERVCGSYQNRSDPNHAVLSDIADGKTINFNKEASGPQIFNMIDCLSKQYSIKIELVD